MYRTRTRTRTALALLGLASLGLVGTACGDDESEAAGTDAPAPTTTAVATTDHSEHETTVPATEPPATTADTTEPATTEPAAEPAADVIEVHTADYGFGGIPAEVPAGTAFEIVNDSAVEVHEIVAVRLLDTETRSVHEIVQAGDFGALFASGPEPALVTVAGPNQGEPFQAVGDGTLTEPGRYAVVCFIPTGADPEAYFAAAAESTGGPVQVEGGAPHVMNGMYAEVVVTA